MKDLENKEIHTQRRQTPTNTSQESLQIESKLAKPNFIEISGKGLQQLEELRTLLQFTKIQPLDIKITIIYRK